MNMPKVFCDRHGKVVADRRNTQHREAKAARTLQPKPRAKTACAVCGAALQGVGVSLPDVGPVCDECLIAAHDAELMDDPRLQTPRKGARRKKAKVV